MSHEMDPPDHLGGSIFIKELCLHLEANHKCSLPQQARRKPLELKPCPHLR